MRLTAERIQTNHLPDAPGVYRINCTQTGECYVGGSASVRKRALQHTAQLAYGEHYSHAMQSRYRELGPSAFSFEVLDQCDISDLSAREEAWIAKLSPAFNTTEKVGIIRVPKQKRSRNERPPRPQSYIPKPGTITHSDRYVRRKEMADAIRSGEPTAKVAERFRVTTQTVLLAAREFKVGSREAKRAARAALISGLARSGKIGTEIAEELGMDDSTVSNYLRAAGLNRRRGRRRGIPNPSVAFVPRDVWESLDWTKQDTVLAQQLLISRERVRQVRKMLGKDKSPDHWQRTEAVAAAS